jgi:hypothetical protein
VAFRHSTSKEQVGKNVSKMSSKTAPNGIVLYNYDSSPYGKRVSAYLALRGIDYALCVCSVLTHKQGQRLTSIGTTERNATS